MVMNKIINKEILNESVIKMDISAPLIAKKAKPGQFIILRADELGERVPFTISDTNADLGTVTIIFQIVGTSTQKLSQLEAGDSVLDFTGPLGKPSMLDGCKKVAVVGGGLGAAIAYPQAKYLFSSGAEVHAILGFRNKNLIILEEEIKKVSTKAYIATDDGSNGRQGFVTTVLESLINEGNNYDLVIAIGPLVMMRAVCELTKKYNIKTIISMNSIMIDGTGMCGGCRLTVAGETKFACIDGPEFDGHLVDFDNAILRSKMYKEKEEESKEHHKCRLEALKNG